MGIAGIECLRRHGASNGGNCRNFVTQLARQKKTHKPTVGHTGRIHPVQVDIVRRRMAINQCRCEPDIIHGASDGPAAHVKMGIAIEQCSLRMHNNEVGGVGDGTKVTIEHLLFCTAGISVEIKHQRHRRVTSINGWDKKDIIPLNAIMHDGAIDGLLGFDGK